MSGHSGPSARADRSAACAETLSDQNGGDVHVTALAPGGTAADRNWMDSNTLFYFSWWIAWSPFVGMFIAKISRGRTVREVINGALTAPVIYCFVWFAVFGGTGLRIERQAANLGITCTEAPDGVTVFERMMEGNRAVPLSGPVVELEGREWWRLSCRSPTEQWFDMFANFPMTKCALPARHTPAHTPHARHRLRLCLGWHHA